MSTVSDLYEYLDVLKDYFTPEYLLDSIVRTMTYDELKSCLEYIARMVDIPIVIEFGEIDV